LSAVDRQGTQLVITVKRAQNSQHFTPHPVLNDTTP